MSALLRPGLAVLAAVEWALGLWTAFFPRSFYEDYPTVDLTPPFSEHLMRDLGGAARGLAVVLAAAAIRPERGLAGTALLAYLAFAVPHLVFHLGHLHGASDADAAVLVTSLVASVLLPVGLLVLVLRRRPVISRRDPVMDAADRPVV